MEKAPELCPSCQAKLRETAAKMLRGLDENAVAFLGVPDDPRIPFWIDGIGVDGRNAEYAEALRINTVA